MRGRKSNKAQETKSPRWRLRPYVSRCHYTVTLLEITRDVRDYPKSNEKKFIDLQIFNVLQSARANAKCPEKKEKAKTNKSTDFLYKTYKAFETLDHGERCIRLKRSRANMTVKDEEYIGEASKWPFTFLMKVASRAREMEAAGGGMESIL